MPRAFDPAQNHTRTKKLIGYVPRKKATSDTYSKLGFKSGLEIHQQLKTRTKLFCRCPAGIYQTYGSYDAELVRHMRPTLSELGEYDGTALMEFKTKKEILYRLCYETACTYDIDDTPPFLLNREALSIAMEIALLLKTSIVGELHITRKQYLDGSIPTGFQRTGIVGIEGSIPLSGKTIRIIQLSIEEDACREVSDVGHMRVYTTDRLGIPLIETVTYPDMETPDEVEEAAHYLRFLARSTGKVNTGIGAARQDVNVSIAGGTRVEIKGVAHIRWIPELTHNEAFRQRALLEIRDKVKKKGNPAVWKIRSLALGPDLLKKTSGMKNRMKTKYGFEKAGEPGYEVYAVNLPRFEGILSSFTQPGKSFADEISDRLKVIACIEKPNMVHSEALSHALSKKDLSTVRSFLGSRAGDAQILVWGPSRDIPTALETIQDRCRLAFQGVPNETRKILPDFTTVFERVLPGPDRMYPDTDSAPIPISEQLITEARGRLPVDLHEQKEKMSAWNIPGDVHPFIFRRTLFPVLEQLIALGMEPKAAGLFLGHHYKRTVGKYGLSGAPEPNRIIELFLFMKKNHIHFDLAGVLLPQMAEHPSSDFKDLLARVGYRKLKPETLLAKIPAQRKAFRRIKKSGSPGAANRWIMGRLRPLAMGNMDLEALRRAVDGALS